MDLGLCILRRRGGQGSNKDWEQERGVGLKQILGEGEGGGAQAKLGRGRGGWGSSKDWRKR